jgi:hypothetical protein
VTVGFIRKPYHSAAITIASTPESRSFIERLGGAKLQRAHWSEFVIFMRHLVEVGDPFADIDRYESLDSHLTPGALRLQQRIARRGHEPLLNLALFVQLNQQRTGHFNLSYLFDQLLVRVVIVVVLTSD